MSFRRLLTLLTLGLLTLVLTSIGSAIAASNTVPTTRVGEHRASITVNDLKPPDCAGLTLGSLVTGSGTFAGTTASELLLGAAGNDTIDAADGNDCILAGAGDDHLIGGPGTDICLGGSGTNTYDPTCETTDAPACPSPGSQTVIATMDSYIAQEDPNRNGATTQELLVMSRLSRNMRVSLYFPLPQLPAGCSVTTSTLRVFRVEGTSGRTIQARRITAAWTETGITWANQPPQADPAASSTAPSGSAWQTWTVTTQVANMYSSSNHGFMLRDEVEDLNELKQVYRSREHANKPELIVNWG